MKSIFLVMVALVLTACGGGGGSSSSYTVTLAGEGKTYSCASQSAFDACSGGSCTACIDPVKNCSGEVRQYNL